MRLLVIAILLWGTVTAAQASSLCGPEQSIGEPNLQALIDTSAKSYARSSSKENVLLQALMRDNSYFKKIFPKRDPAVVGGYYFRTVCSTLLEKSGSSGKIDTLGLEKLRYVAKAFQNQPNVVATLAAIEKTGGSDADVPPKEALAQAPKVEAAGTGFETTVAELPEKKPTQAPAVAGGFGQAQVSQETGDGAGEFATSVDAGTAKSDASAKQQAAEPAKEPSASAGNSSGAGDLPAIVPMAIPQEVLFPAQKSAPAQEQAPSPEPEQVAQPAQVSEPEPVAEPAPKEEETADTNFPPKALQSALGDDVRNDDAEVAADTTPEQSAQTEFDLTTGSSSNGSAPPAKIIDSPSCSDMGISDQGSCGRFQSLLSRLKAVPLEFTHPRTMQPGKKFRVSLTFRPENKDLKGLVPNSGSQGSHMLQAALSGNAFDVEPKGPQKRVLNSLEPVKWTWFVTPLQEGVDETLGLDFDAVVRFSGGALAPVTIKSYRNDITVGGQWWEPIAFAFGGIDPMLLAMAGIFTFVLLVFGGWRTISRRRQSEGDVLSEPADYAREIANYQASNAGRTEATMFLVSENNNR